MRILAAKISDVAAGSMRIVEARGVRIALCNVEGTFYAVEDVCTHDDGPLEEGKIVGRQVECPRHGARFDLSTGRATRMPAVVPVRVFPVQVEGDSVYIEVQNHGS